MKFLPAVVIHMYPALFAKAVSTIANMSRANFFYIIAYPEYSGYRVEHDPTFTAYIATESVATPTPSASPDQPISGGLIIIAIVIVAFGIALAILISQRKPS
jgi:hypothetical protein